MKRNIKKRNRRKRSRVTWTKAITRILLIIGVIGGLLPYVLSLLDKQPVESMGIAWVTEIVAVCLGYFVRGYKDTANQEDIALRRAMAGLEMSDLYDGAYQDDQSTPQDENENHDGEEAVV